MDVITVLLGILGLVLGVFAGYILRKKSAELKDKELAEKAEKILSEARKKSQDMVLDAKNSAFKIQDEAKNEERKKREHLNKLEAHVADKEKNLDKKGLELEKMQSDLETKIESVQKMRTELEQLHEQQEIQLAKISGLSRDEAKDMLLAKVEEDSKEEMLQAMQKVEAEVKQESKKRAQYIIADAIQRCAHETTAESTSTVVNLPSDDLKGRIIGREGRNINTFEQITGIDVIVDDTPGSIVISGFDLVRRYIAKVTLERLIEDGRIHPARIEETYEKVKEEVNTLIKELGEKAVYDSGVVGLHPNLVKILGRLKFRVSHGQNALKHSLEVCYLSGALAAELGGDVALCQKAGLLHDIGKAVDHEVVGHHAKIGADIARKFGMSNEVAHAIEAHHGEPEPETIEAMIVQAANIISNSRPGATKENLDTFIRRMTELEDMCRSYKGVDKVFAVQAGNQVRVFVNPEDLDDIASQKLAYDLARKIERNFQYPGAVKVNVIRETRAESVAL